MQQKDFLFTFVVVADTHVNESDGVSSSPYHTNALANERARHVFLDIAAIDPVPEFVVHLGDIVHPVPALPTFDDAVNCFKEMIQPVKCPVHLVPGNHDVGDKRVRWTPADQVCDGFLDTYREAFGPDYSSFDHQGLRFILLNSLLINSGLDDEQRQKDWLDGQLASAAGRRVYLFMHYPPYIYSTDERGNYDNLDEPGRSWLLERIRAHGVEAVFAGHVHNFWYDRIDEAEFYMLPSTAFLRHDFTEFYSVVPEVEFGRGEVEKFGYFVVDVYRNGHVVHPVRTMGAQADRGVQALANPLPRYLTHPKVADFDRFGVELRHPWAQSMQITATGGVQEFGRKWARNDYPLLATWEMGLRLAKVPDVDLLEPESRARMQLMARMGQTYMVTVLGNLRPALLELDLQACGVRAFEVNTTVAQFEQSKAQWRGLREQSGVQIYYSPIQEPSKDQYDGRHFSHFIRAGLSVSALQAQGEQWSAAVREGCIDGVTVRVEASEDLPEVARALMAFHDQTGVRILASLKLAGPSLAVLRAEDSANARTLAQAMILSKASEGIHYVFDTFMDVDRGYFPRHAFIDRRFNPRKMANAATMLSTILKACGPVRLLPDPAGGEALCFEAASARYALLAGLPDRVSGWLAQHGKPLSLHNLLTGEHGLGQTDGQAMALLLARLS